ncbi:MAG TPA: YlxR family protein [Anaerolineales bacterium]|nr:YlxR family protein [Anaerolineales bacterium]
MTPNSAKTKKVPQRTCVGCRKVDPKKSLIRVVRTPEGVFVDPNGKLNGRGAYIHEQRSCWQAALKDSLARALKTTLTEEDRARLEAKLQTLPDDTATDNAENVQT